MARLIDIGAVFLLNVAVNGWFVYQYWLEIRPTIVEAWRRALTNEPPSMADLPQPGPDAGNLQIVIVLIAAALWFAYEVPAIANTGQTPGKRLLNIKVVRLESDQPLGFGRSFRRWNTMGLPTLLWICFVGFILQFIDALFVAIDRPLHQAIHDKSAHTVVVAVLPSGSCHERLTRPDLAQLPSYVPGRSAPGAIKLASNEVPFARCPVSPKRRRGRGAGPPVPGHGGGRATEAPPSGG